MTKHTMMTGRVENGFILDACHDQVHVGDVFIADYRGTPDQRFEVIEDDGGGLFRVRRPDGEESLMRPSTILNVAKRLLYPRTSHDRDDYNDEACG